MTWAEAGCRFGSKAQTLQGLSGRLRRGRTLPQHTFTVAEWRANAVGVLHDILACEWAGGAGLLARSSALHEDGEGGRHAGRYRSVAAADATQLPAAVDGVIESYGSDAGDRDEVFVQPLLSKVRVCGVAVTADPSTGGPYYVINYAEGGDTSAVTSGRAETSTYYHAKADDSLPAGWLGDVLAVCRELEAQFGHANLDIEFAVCEQGLPVVLQVRRLAPATQAADASLIARAATQLGALREREPFLLGERTVYGVMPDWNPAEILGTRPRPLALSLYRYLITDRTWADQRADYGYRDVRGHPLLVSVQGAPFIDTRASFNSLIPAAVADTTAEKLVDHYVRRLAAQPELHDKVEFDIAITACTPDFALRSARLQADGLDRGELERLGASLRALTNAVLFDGPAQDQEHARLAALARRRERLADESLPLAARVRWLLQDCRELGARAFAGLARAEFIAADVVRGLEALGEISPAQRHALHAHARTIAACMRDDLAALPRAQFLARYGHLRPGTYDITSPRYDADGERYFPSAEVVAAPAAALPAEAVSASQRQSLDALLEACGLHADFAGLASCLQRLVQARDFAKFEFTRSLSDALEAIARLGERLGLDREALSYTDARLFTGPSAEIDGLALARAAEQGRAAYERSLGLTLPPIIREPAECVGFHLPAVRPNFVTSGKVRAVVRAADDPRGLLGAIVAIPSADPGYDWIFAHGIAGLVTAYGGVNSHMAVRARALNLPAVIGAGEKLYAQWSRAQALEIDSLNQLVLPL